MEEFAAFKWQEEPPDPQDEATFLRCKLNHKRWRRGQQKMLLEYYGELIRLRKAVPAIACMSKEQMDVIGFEEQQVIFIRRWHEESEIFAALNFAEASASIELPVPAGDWRRYLDSADLRWKGPGSSIPMTVHSEGQAMLELAPTSIALYAREER
jgi:maltooligosyltrehalose trehalohydrolase